METLTIKTLLGHDLSPSPPPLPPCYHSWDVGLSFLTLDHDEDKKGGCMILGQLEMNKEREILC